MEVLPAEFAGYEPGDLGSHMLRKGATSWMSNGSTIAPPTDAIDHRGGWTQGPISAVYREQREGSDGFCGRCVAGLPMERAELSAVCPYFSPKKIREREGADSMKTTAYNVCFAGLSESLTPVANMCLASFTITKRRFDI